MASAFDPSMFGAQPPANDPGLGAFGGNVPQPTLDPSAAGTAPGSIGQTILNVEPVEDDSVIKKLRPGSMKHSAVMEKLQAMVKFSSNKMGENYSRWRNSEMKVQAYMLQQDYKELVTTVESSRGAVIPEPIQVVVPYTYATLHAAATYMATVLLGRKPLFPLMGTRNTSAETARHMEFALQSNLDNCMGQEHLWQHIWDGLLYSMSPIKTGWSVVSGKTMRMNGGVRSFSDEVKYAGNTIAAVDPYRFLPDPRVPLSQCHKLGDFMFDMTPMSELVLRDMETNGLLKWTKEAIARAGRTARNRGIGTEGDYTSNRGPGGNRDLLNPRDVVGFIPVYEGTVRLVPKDWGLGDETKSEIWRFVFTKEQILAAQPHGAIHEQHPYLVGEPTSLGHDFMSLSQAEMINVFQDVLSWLVSSRMENVRSSIANSYVYDPARVETNDMRSSAIGRLIRLKQSAMGLPIKDAIMQLQVNDVTGGHFTDISVLRTLADAATGVNDNLRGIQTNGGRRSATEARMSMQAGASRLSQLAMRLSGQSFQGLAQQMILNIQQYMPLDFWIETTGDEGGSSLKLTVDQLIGTFNFQVSDGTLPLDKGALLEQWKEILFGIAQDPELRQAYSLAEIFRYVAQLGGAKNIDSFQRKQEKTIAPAGVDPGADPNAVPVNSPVPPMPAALAFQP